MMKSTLLLTLLGAVAAAASPIEKLQTWLALERADRPPIAAQQFAKAPLGKDDAPRAGELLWADRLARLRAERAAEVAAHEVRLGGKTMRYLVKEFGEKPPGRRRLVK